MFKNIKIENFRCFKSFELQQLGRVNLLVGENNSGKTSILEAIQLLCSRTNLEPLSEMMIHRGEYFWNDNDKENRELDIKHIFYGHEIETNTRLSISGTQENILEQLNLSIGMHSTSLPNFIKDLSEDVTVHNLLKLLGNNQENIDNEFLDNFTKSELSVEWIHGDASKEIKIPLSSNDCLNKNIVRNSSKEIIDGQQRIQSVTSSSLTIQKMLRLFDELVLTPEEKLITEALQIIEPKIERIASITSTKIRNSESKASFVVRLSDSNQRVPIGSMGDGVWRMLGLALAIVCAKDGVLFVDEIDTGLHFTAMSDMWKLIWETAKRLNVQVFATTHNSDCWRSLASVAREKYAAEDGISIQRIEKDKNVVVSFNEREIVIAAEREIEVR